MLLCILQILQMFSQRTKSYYLFDRYQNIYTSVANGKNVMIQLESNAAKHLHNIKTKIKYLDKKTKDVLELDNKDLSDSVKSDRSGRL